MSIGQRISELRVKHGMTQYELAKVMEVSRQAVSKWESDQSTPNPVKLIQLADVLDTDLEYLSTGRVVSKPLPVVINNVVTIEEIVEKPVIHTVEKVIEKPVIKYVEKPVLKKVYRNHYIRNPLEFAVFGVICLIIGFLAGLIF